MKSRDPYCRNKASRLGDISLQISRLMGDTDLNIDHFINTIRFNSELSATIIEIVNRGYSGFTGEIDCISRAVRMLGIGQLHYIVNCIRDSEAQSCNQYHNSVDHDTGEFEDSTEMKLAG